MRIFAFALALVACGSSSPSSPTAAAPAAKSGATAETYFPLEEGKIYHYVTNDNGETGMLVAKVHRVDATHGELRLTGSTKRFVYSDAGVAYDTGVFILKTPIEVGVSWAGEHGGSTRIAKTDASVGTYSGCVQTVEEGGRMPGAKYTTTYCPGVGMALLEVQSPMGDARAELKSYGFPVKIE